MVNIFKMMRNEKALTSQREIRLGDTKEHDATK